MSVLTGWHRHLVFCNRNLIASFPTEALRDAFIRERASKYPRGEYTTGEDWR
jgi:hypothetical protein